MTMTSPLDPNVWADIAAEEALTGTVVRRVLPSLAHDVFVGEQRPSRERVLQLDIVDGLSVPPVRHSSRGLHVSVESKSPAMTSFRLSAASNSDNSIFADFASDVVGVLEKDPSEGAAARVLERVLALSLIHI